MRRPGLYALVVLGALSLSTVVWATHPRPAPPHVVTGAGLHPRPETASVAALSGVADSEEGARATAIDIASASQAWLHLDDAAVAQAVSSISTPAAAPTLSSQTVAAMHTARLALSASSGPVWWLVRPLASNVEHFDAASAQVSVWTITILSAPGIAPPQAEWMRVVVELSYLGGSWKLSAISQTPGPTPMSGAKDQPWQAGAFGAALAGFQAVSTEVPR